MSHAAPDPIRVLLVEDNPGDVFLLQELVDEEPGSRFRISHAVDRLDAALELIAGHEADLVLLDLSLPDSGGLETFARAHAAAPEVPIIVLSGTDDEKMALETVHLGAHEYLVKGRIDAVLLHRAMRYAIERSRAERDLARERDLLHTLIDNIPDRIYFKDSESRFIRINHALTRLFRMERPEQAYGKTDADFYGIEHAREALEDERRVMETGEPIINKIEYETMTTGRRSWSLTSKLPLRDRQGRIIGTCGISREITKLKEMEEELAKERNVLRSVIDNLPDLIFLKDMEGRYLLDNLAHRQWLRASEASEVVGRTGFDFFPEEMAREFDADDRALLRSGQPLYNHEERMVDPQGHARWVLTTKVPWRADDGAIHGLLGITRDITTNRASNPRAIINKASKASVVNRVSKGNKANAVNRVSKDNKDSKDSKDNRGSKDNRDNRGNSPAANKVVAAARVRKMLMAGCRRTHRAVAACRWAEIVNLAPKCANGCAKCKT